MYFYISIYLSIYKLHICATVFFFSMSHSNSYTQRAKVILTNSTNISKVFSQYIYIYIYIYFFFACCIFFFLNFKLHIYLQQFWVLFSITCCIHSVTNKYSHG